MKIVVSALWDAPFQNGEALSAYVPSSVRELRGAPHALLIGENEVPDSTEAFLRLVEPYGRFSVKLVDGTRHVHFENDYD